MRISLLVILMVVLGSGLIQAATNYETDEQYFYVDEPLNDSLQGASMIMCIMSSMRPDAFVNDGNYLAAVSLEDCIKEAESGSDSAQQLATQKPDSVEDKNKQAAGASSNKGERKDQKSIIESLVNVTRNSKEEPVITKAWIGHNDSEMQGKVYARIEQTAGVSSGAPNGEFEMHWTAMADESHPYTTDGEFQAWGFLKAKGSTISMIEESLDYAEKFTATYGEDGTVEGTFVADFDPDIEDKDNSFYQAFYKFYINDKDKSYCKKLIGVEKTSLKTTAQKGGLYITQTVPAASYVDLGKKNANEVCFSTKRAEATRNVFSYGVYNQDGSRLDIGLTDLSLQAEVIDKDGDRVNVYAHADSNDVWVDYEYAHLVNDNTVFKQEVYGDEQVKSDKNYRVKRSQISVERYQTGRVSLKSLDAMPFEVDGIQAKEFFGVSYPANDDNLFYDYRGIYDAKAQVFTLTHRGVFSRSGGEYIREPLVASDHKKDINSMANGMADDVSFSLYFPNSQRSYQVSKQALNNHNALQVRTKVATQLSLSDMQGKALFCVDNCVTAATVKKTFDDAKVELKKEHDTDTDTDTDTVEVKTITSPYVVYDADADAGESLGSLIEYKFSNNKIYSSDIQDSNQIFKDDIFGGLLNSAYDYYDQLEPIVFGDDQWSIAWGIDAGILVEKDDLEKLKCQLDVDGVSVDENNYCVSQFWKNYDDIATYYVVRYEVEPSFELFTESGESVEFVEPKTLFYTVPEGEQKEAGNRFVLDYYGHEQLWGIPSQIYDTDNGEYLGKYMREWKESYRYVDQFTIPDNGELEDDKGNKYKVKALFGEEWLKKAPDFVGKYSYTGNKEQIPSDDKLFVKDGLDTLGAMPKDNIINNGKLSVFHSEIIYDPSPNAK